MDSVLTIIQGATDGLLPVLLAVGGAGIAVSAGLLALSKGWGFFRKSVK
jgi:hypothetical protein